MAVASDVLQYRPVVRGGWCETGMRGGGGGWGGLYIEGRKRHEDLHTALQPQLKLEAGAGSQTPTAMEPAPPPFATGPLQLESLAGSRLKYS